MISNLIEKNNQYYCSNCRMRQNDLKEHLSCTFCGYTFSNWAEVQIKIFKEQEEDKRREELENESNIC